MKFLYSIGIRLFSLGVFIASFFNEKARLLSKGRNGTIQRLAQWRKQNPGKLVWMHCASLGEFEQGRPLLEAIRKEEKNIRLLLTFFSPSGYEVRKEYAGADHVCYLPADTVSNAEAFINAAQPSVALIVKYEYWANYFFTCKKKNIPLLMISAILRPDQRFFGSFSGFWKKVLGCVDHFFAQNYETEELLKSHGFMNVTLAGDTRFDRVVAIKDSATEIAEIKKFCGNSFCVVAGSTWPEEEKFLAAWKNGQQEPVRLIIVPHEIGQSHIASISVLMQNSVKWSERGSKELEACDILIVDTIGMLSSIYRYADVAVIGGGFGKGIHNILEAAVWNIPVIFGPNYQKFDEAKQLIRMGGAFAVSGAMAFEELMDQMRREDGFRKGAGSTAGEFVAAGTGATTKILAHIRPLIKSVN